MTRVAPTDRERVAAAVEPLADGVIAFAADLVSEPSVQGEETGAQRLVADRLAELGLDARRVEASEVDGREDHSELYDAGLSYSGQPNVVATGEGSDGGRSLLSNGHVDVVPAGDEDQWSFDRFARRVEDGRLLGRGASDLKGGVAATVYALEALSTAGVELVEDLTLASVIGEGVGGFGSSLATVLDDVTDGDDTAFARATSDAEGGE